MADYDFTSDPNGQLPAKQPHAEPYEIAKQQEKVRGRLVAVLIVIGYGPLLAAYLLAAVDVFTVDRALRLVGLVTPITAITSAAIGYYFRR